MNLSSIEKKNYYITKNNIGKQKFNEKMLTS